MSDLIDQLEACLPQTQCGECGYAGCRPYAEAMAAGEDTPDHCPPGGLNTLTELSDLLKQKPDPYVETVKKNFRSPSTAIIQADQCIGCTKCIAACPVDAIIGAAKQLHTILVDECTGCGLCVDPCPVDCIDLAAIPAARYDPSKAKSRYFAREKRLKDKKDKKIKKLSNTEKSHYIQAAIKRTQSKRESQK